MLLVLAKLIQGEPLSERLGISFDEDIFFISESEVSIISTLLPIVSRMKLYHSYVMPFDDTIADHLKVNEICSSLDSAVEHKVKLNYSVFEARWRTEVEILTILETLRMVPITKTESMLLKNDDNNNVQRNYDEAWNVINSNPPADGTIFMREIGLLDASDLMYVPNETLVTLSQ